MEMRLRLFRRTFGHLIVRRNGFSVNIGRVFCSFRVDIL